MNRFLNKKKKDGAEDGLSSAFGTKKNKKPKRGEPEAPPALDLATALPSTDNFRTSLLMPNLSARFSMLREQDDPNSIIGKASDDSVLHPNRKSRLVDYGFNFTNLTDIAEVSSIKSSVRPPFASERESMRTSDGYGTEEDEARRSGGIMSRARPGEGNVLFGGRQKVYKVPAGISTVNRGMGRVLYDDDVGLSAFQRLKMEEREKNTTTRHDDVNSQLPKDEGFAESPAAALLEKRDTMSSTQSGQLMTRSSTAATSVSSRATHSVHSSPPKSLLANVQMAGAERSNSRARRLYEAGLDQQIHEQQNSILNRFNSMQKQRPIPTRTPPPIAQARNRTDFELPQDHPAMDASVAQASASAPLTSLKQQLEFKEDKLFGSAIESVVRRSPPMSPLSTGYQGNSALTSALQPNDRGKATALGTFNRPKLFDERQYSERQIRLQQGRESPSPVQSAPESPINRERKDSDTSALGNRLTNLSKPNNEPLNVAATMVADHSENLSKSGDESSNVTNKDVVPLTQDSTLVVQRELSDAAVDSHDSTAVENDPQIEVPPLNISPGTCEDDKKTAQQSCLSPDVRRRLYERRKAVIPQGRAQPPPTADHPALRSAPLRDLEIIVRNNQPQPPPPQCQPAESNAPAQTPASQSASTEDAARITVDLPILQRPESPVGGMIQKHLRKISNVSSIYSTSSLIPSATQEEFHLPELASIDSDTPVHSVYSQSNPWDLEDSERYPEPDSASSISPADSSILQRQPSPLKMQMTPSTTSSYEGMDTKTQEAWEQDIKKKHIREASQENRQEREAFAQELVQRQRAIQESLRIKVEGDSRSSSPSPNPNASLKPWNILRSKSSRDSMNNNKHDMQLKSSKTLHGASSENRGRGDQRSEKTSTIASPHNSPPMPRRMEVNEHSGGDHQFHELGRMRKPSLPGSPLPRVPHAFIGRDRSASKPDGQPLYSPSGYRERLDFVSEARSGAMPLDREMQINAPQMPSNSVRVAAEAQSPPSTGRFRSMSRSKGPVPLEARIGVDTQSSLSPPSSASHSPGVFPGLSSGSVPIQSPNGHVSGPGLIPAGSRSATPTQRGVAPLLPGFGPPSQPPNARLPAAPHRRRQFQKSDISEPRFISTTSVVDTIALPPGSSLRNGQQIVPPVPPLHPLRRYGVKVPGFRSSPSSGTTSPEGRYFPSNTPRGVPNWAPETPPMESFGVEPVNQGPILRAKQKLRKVASESHGLSSRSLQQSNNPQYRSRQYSVPEKNGLPVVLRPGAQDIPAPAEGAMF